MAVNQLIISDERSDIKVSIGGSSIWTRRSRGLVQRVRSIGFRAFISLSLSSVLFVVAGGVAAHATQGNATVATAATKVLVKSDFPKSWTSTKSSNNNSSIPGAAQLATCIGVPASVVTSNPPTAYSPEFDSSNQLQSVDDSVSIYSSTTDANADFNSLANPKTPSCLTSVLNGPAKASLEKELGSVSLVGKIAVTRAPATDFAPRGTNFKMSMRLKSHGVQVDVEMTIVDYVKANVEQTLTLISVVTGFPATLAKQLTTDAVSLIQ